jgi:hypothetical protein
LVMKNRRLFGWVLVLALVAAALLYYAGVAPAMVGKERVAQAFAAVQTFPPADGGARQRSFY